MRNEGESVEGRSKVQIHVLISTIYGMIFPAIQFALLRRLGVFGILAIGNMIYAWVMNYTTQKYSTDKKVYNLFLGINGAWITVLIAWNIGLVTYMISEGKVWSGILAGSIFIAIILCKNIVEDKFTNRNGMKTFKWIGIGIILLAILVMLCFQRYIVIGALLLWIPGMYCVLDSRLLIRYFKNEYDKKSEQV